MKISFLLVVIGCFMWTSTQAQQVQFSCTHMKGERLFKANSIILERDGSSVLVRSVVNPKDHWTYRIVYEAPEFIEGFRSIRVSEMGGPVGPILDVLLGGELIYFVEEGKARIEVTSLNASSGESSFSTMACK